MSEEIKPRYDDGEPVCSRDCPEYGANDHCMSRSPKCYLMTVHPCHNSPCIPGLRQQRDAALSRVAELEAVVERLEAESKRWRAMFEHTALVVADMIEAHGLAGDEATEEIAKWVALAEKEVEG